MAVNTGTLTVMEDDHVENETNNNIRIIAGDFVC